MIVFCALLVSTVERFGKVMNNLFFENVKVEIQHFTNADKELQDKMEARLAPKVIKSVENQPISSDDPLKQRLLE